ncbi:MAG: addiction module protein [Verrucomicrobia bacterium]|nr:addiction module protein [Verrucomicrobiota bacterium]
MPKTLSQVAQDAVELPASDRMKLARLILDSTDFDSASSDQARKEWDEEIKTRLRELRSGQVVGVPLEEVKRRIEAGFKS